MFAPPSRPFRAREGQLLCWDPSVNFPAECQRDEVLQPIGDKAEEAAASPTPGKSVDGDLVLRWHFPHSQEASGAANTWAPTPSLDGKVVAAGWGRSSS